jgi:hypothetical protein
LRLRSLSARMRCTSTCFRDPHSSHSSAVGHEPLDDLGTCAPGAGGVVVEGPWRGVPCQGDAAPLRGRRRFSVPVHRDPKAPAGSVLGVEDDTAAAVDLRARILDAVDRGNPCGKRDDAIILLVTRLGLRSIDVKRLEFADFDWPGCRLSVAQAKTGSQVARAAHVPPGEDRPLKEGHCRNCWPQAALQAAGTARRAPDLGLADFAAVRWHHLSFAGVARMNRRPRLPRPDKAPPQSSRLRHSPVQAGGHPLLLRYDLPRTETQLALLEVIDRTTLDFDQRASGNQARRVRGPSIGHMPRSRTASSIRLLSMTTP